MRMPFVALGLTAALCWSVVGAEKTSSVRTRREARADFERARVPSFAGRTVLPAERAAKEYADFTATGVVWTIALSVDGGSRLRFAEVTFRDGAFADGTLHVMGLPAARLTADDFAALRREYAMLAVCDRKGAPACLLRPTTRALSKSVPERQAIDLSVDPLRELYGEAFLEAIRRLRVNLGSVRCRVDFAGPDGKRFALGEVGIPRHPERLDAKAICVSVGAACPRLVSERERVEYYLKGALSYELVLPQEGKEVRK